MIEWTINKAIKLILPKQKNKAFLSLSLHDKIWLLQKKQIKGILFLPTKMHFSTISSVSQAIESFWEERWKPD